MRPLDYLVIGGGYAGCNALAALQDSAAPGSTVLCASISPPGGSWHDYYDYATLHAPHPQFGVSGQLWDIQDPNTLATRQQVIQHFNQYVDTLPDRCDFAAGVEFVRSENDCCTDGTDLIERLGKGVRATLRDVASGEETDLLAKHIIDARGYFFKGHRHRESDLHFQGAGLSEIQVTEVSAKLGEVKGSECSKRPRM